MPNIEEFQVRLAESSSYAAEIHRRAARDGRFLSGGAGQWEKEDLELLRRQKRPALSIDQIGKIVRSVSGSEIVNRHEAHFYPRGIDIDDIDGVVSDALNSIYKYIRQRADMEHMESRAFRDAVALGVGFTETFPDFFEDPDGKVVTRWVPLNEMAWDPDARQQNLSDSRYFIRAHWLSEKDFASRWPDHGELLSYLATGESDKAFVGFGSSTRAGDYRDVGKGWFDKATRRILVYEWQYYVDERDWWRVYLPADSPAVPYSSDGESISVVQPGTGNWVSKDDSDDFLAAAELIGYNVRDIQSQMMVEMPRRRHYTMHVTSNTELSKEPTTVNAFTYLAITAFEDNSDEYTQNWMGLVRALRDPQRLLNKTLSQMVHRINMSPSALVTEEGVFTDKAKALNDLNDPTAHVEVVPGGLGRIMPKYPGNPLPSGLGDLLMIAADSFSRVSGINDAFLGGQADLRRVSGTAVQSVAGSATVLLSVLMDSLRAYRKTHARLVLSHIREFLPVSQINRILDPDRRFVPIIGPNGEQAQGPAIADILKTEEPYKYDIVVDESPTTPNAKDEFRRDMMEQGFLLTWIQSGRQIPESIFEYMNFPPKLAQQMIAEEREFKQRQQMAEMQQQAAANTPNMTEVPQNA